MTKKEDFFSAWNSCLHHVASLSLAHTHRGQLLLIDLGCLAGSGSACQLEMQLCREESPHPCGPLHASKAPNSSKSLDACHKLTPYLMSALTRWHTQSPVLNPPGPTQSLRITTGTGQGSQQMPLLTDCNHHCTSTTA